MKQILAIFLALTLALILNIVIFPVYPVMAQDTIYVDDDNITSPWDGTEENPYQNIQDAIDSASSGDVIMIMEGIYNEWLTIDKPLTLQGENRDTTILEASTTSSKDGITVKNISGVTIRNLTIRKYRFDIYLENSHNNFITNNIITDLGPLINVDYCGIRTSNADNNMINNNIIRNNEYGISLHSSSDGNIIENNTFINNEQNAIRLNWSSNNIVKNNSVTNNGYGINIEYHANENIIEENNISNNSNHGIRLFRCIQNKVLNNIISDNEQHGILLSDAVDSEILGNNISRNGGITTNPTYGGITITYESVLFGSAGNIIAYNTISDHPQEAIKLLSNYVTETEIYNNTIENNKYGIYIHNATNSLVYNNNFINNTTQAKDHWMNSSAFNRSIPTGGNYWSDWTGPDVDSDGFVDKPYKFVFFVVDNLPWANPNGWLTPQNRPPDANIGDSYVSTENDPIDFDAGSSSDDDGDPLQFRWDLDGDGTWDTPLSDSPVYDGFEKDDDYSGIIRVKVTDGQASDVDETTVTFNNLAPIIDILKSDPENPQCYSMPIEFTGIGKDPGQDELTFEWDFGDGNTKTYYALGGPFNMTVLHTYGDWGDYTVTLTVWDDDGGGTIAHLPISLWDTKAPKVLCEEAVNPHGDVIPGEERGKNGKQKNNQNPGGFYQIFGIDNCDPSPEIYIGTIEDPYLFGPFESGVVIKFTEAAGAEPSIKKIGSINGQAGAVTWHITLPSDPVVTVVDAAGNTDFCDRCLVPPPPM